MVDVTIQNGAAVFEVLGLHKLWALKSRIEVPLAHIRAVRTDPSVKLGWWKGWRMPGTHVPGLIVAGTYYHGRRRIFWDVVRTTRTIVVDLTDEPTTSSLLKSLTLTQPFTGLRLLAALRACHVFRVRDCPDRSSCSLRNEQHSSLWRNRRLFVLGAACGSPAPTSPTGTSQAPALPSPIPPTATNVPPLSGPSRTFVFDRELSYRVSDYTKQSRLSVAGPWGATGVLKGDSLTVQYNQIMLWTDFEDAVYVRIP